MGLLKAHLGLRLFILLSRSGLMIIKLSSTSFELVLQNCPVRTLICNGYCVLISRSSITSTKIVIKSFMTASVEIYRYIVKPIEAIASNIFLFYKQAGY